MNFSRKYKKSILIIGILLVFLFCWNFYRVNAFYFSYQRHDSLEKQQVAFFKSVTESQLKRLGYQPIPLEGSWKLIGFYSNGTKNDYRFSNDGNGKIEISIYNNENEKRLASIYLNANQHRYDYYYNGVKTRSITAYQKEALQNYRYALKKVYNHWHFSLLYIY